MSSAGAISNAFHYFFFILPHRVPLWCEQLTALLKRNEGRNDGWPTRIFRSTLNRIFSFIFSLFFLFFWYCGLVRIVLLSDLVERCIRATESEWLIREKWERNHFLLFFLFYNQAADQIWRTAIMKEELRKNEGWVERCCCVSLLCIHQ